MNSVIADDHKPARYITDIVNSYINAEEDKEYYKIYSSDSIELAYLIQASYVQKKAKSIVGYKIGLSSRAAQKKFKHQSPVFGVLIHQPRNQEDMIKSSPVKHLLEVELGFLIKDSITDLDQLDQPIENLVSAVVPVIEIPTINFQDINAITAFDIIASNVGAATFIAGEFVDLNKIDVNNIRVELWHEEQVIMQGVSSAPFNNQLDALAWLLRQALLQGYNLDKGHVLLTGSILKPRLITSGEFTAKFEGLQNINIHIK